MESLTNCVTPTCYPVCTRSTVSNSLTSVFIQLSLVFLFHWPPGEGYH